MGVGPWLTPFWLPLLQPARSPEPTRPPCEFPPPLGCSAVAPSPRVDAAGLRLRRVAQAALLQLRAEGPQRCRELPLQGWLSCSRLDAAWAGGGMRARRPRRAPPSPQTRARFRGQTRPIWPSHGGRKRHEIRIKFFWTSVGPPL